MADVGDSAVEEAECLGVCCEFVECEAAALKVGAQEVEGVVSRDAPVPVHGIRAQPGNGRPVTRQSAGRCDPPTVVVGSCGYEALAVTVPVMNRAW